MFTRGLQKGLLVLLALILNLAMTTAFAADALLGPGDSIKIAVFGNPELSLETRIGERGQISYPLLGEVDIGGITPSAAEAKIARLLESGKFIRNPQVTILVPIMQSQQISVLGQVKNPGRYPMDGVRSLADIIALAGGVTPDGSDEVTLIRTVNGVQHKQSVNIVAMLRDTESTANPKIEGGDTVFVERAPHFYIYGEVQRPGSYKLERNMIVLQGLSLGGGLTPRGTERGIRVKRRNTQGELEIFDAKADDPVRPDDIILIKESLF